MSSEVARLRRQIELECEAMQRALEGPALVGCHEFIRVKHDNLERHRQALAEVVGEMEANRISAEVYFKALEERLPTGNVDVIKVGHLDRREHTFLEKRDCTGWFWFLRKKRCGARRRYSVRDNLGERRLCRGSS